MKLSQLLRFYFLIVIYCLIVTMIQWQLCRSLPTNFFREIRILICLSAFQFLQFEKLNYIN